MEEIITEEDQFQNEVKFCIVGAGRYGSALGFVLQQHTKNIVCFFVRRQEQADEINNEKTNNKVDELIQFSSNVSATTDIKEAMDGARFIFLCIPTQTLPAFIRQYLAKPIPLLMIVNCSKGMVIKEEKFLNQIIKELHGSLDNYLVLSGPSFAKEMFKKFPTMVTVAGTHKAALDEIQARMYCEFFKIYIQYDVMGVELSGAVKNILALGAGYIDGLGYGYNTMAGFVTRGIKEVQMLSIRFGADPLSLFGLSGAGDIMLSCFGKLSRNRTTGYRLAKGEKLEDVVKDIGTVEGVPTLQVINQLISGFDNGSQFIIIRTIHDLIFGKIKMEEAHKYLMYNSKSLEFRNLPYCAKEGGENTCSQ